MSTHCHAKAYPSLGNKNTNTNKNNKVLRNIPQPICKKIMFLLVVDGDKFTSSIVALQSGLDERPRLSVE